MSVVAIIQARMGSSRLPGKMMFPLDCTPVIRHVIRRTKRAETVDRLVLATSEHRQDDILERYAKKTGTEVFRGSETDVLGRIHEAAVQQDPSTIVRVCADTPLLPPSVIDAVVTRLETNSADYSTTMDPRSFPRGVDVEAFTAESFDRVAERATDSHEREHVTPYYRENPDEFEIVRVDSTEVFEREDLQNRTDLRLTLDEAADYALIEQVYRNVPYDDIVAFEDAVTYVDENGLHSLNEDVTQVTAIQTDNEG